MKPQQPDNILGKIMNTAASEPCRELHPPLSEPIEDPISKTN